jgi:hypothetical protein
MFVGKGALVDGLFQVRYLDGYALTHSFALERLRYGNHDRSASDVERIRAVAKEDVLDAARILCKCTVHHESSVGRRRASGV